MVAIVKRLCIKSFEVTDDDNKYWKAQQGETYTTSKIKNGKVMVFSNYWVPVPESHFVLAE